MLNVKKSLFLICYFILTLSGIQAASTPIAPSLVTHEKSKFTSVIRTIVRYKDQIWYGTYGKGLFTINKDDKLINFTSENSNLLENRVNVLAVYKGDLWIGTCKGINIFNGHKITKAIVAGKGSVAGNIYHCMRVSPDLSEIWVGMTGEGVSIYNGKTWSKAGKEDGILNQWVNDVAFFEDEIWIATFSGTFRKKKGAKKWKTTIPPKFPVHRNTISMTIIDSRDELWIGSVEKGVYCFQEGYWYHPPESLLPSPHVYWLENGSSDLLWIATDKGIASMSLENGWTTYGMKEGLSDPYTKILYFDKKEGLLWAGSYNGTLSVFKNGRFNTLVTKNGLVVR